MHPTPSKLRRTSKPNLTFFDFRPWAFFLFSILALRLSSRSCFRDPKLGLIKLILTKNMQLNSQIAVSNHELHLIMSLCVELATLDKVLGCKPYDGTTLCT